MLRISNLIPFPQVTPFIMLVRRSLSNAGAKVVLYNIRSKYFTKYFVFIFSSKTLLYNVRTKKKRNTGINETDTDKSAEINLAHSVAKSKPVQSISRKKNKDAVHCVFTFQRVCLSTAVVRPFDSYGKAFRQLSKYLPTAVERQIVREINFICSPYIKQNSVFFDIRIRSFAIDAISNLHNRSIRSFTRLWSFPFFIEW